MMKATKYPIRKLEHISMNALKRDGRLYQWEAKVYVKDLTIKKVA